MPSASSGPSYPHMDIDLDRENTVDYLVDSMDIDAPRPDPLTDNLTESGASGATATVHPEPEVDIPVSQATTSETGRPLRQRRLPARYRDILPQSSSPVNAIMNDTEPQTTHITRIQLIVRDTIRTTANMFGLWREYQHRPSYDPDSAVNADNLANLNTDTSNPDPSLVEHDPDSKTVHRNPTIESLINWQNMGSTLKSNNKINRLVRDVLCHPNFSVKDLKGFNTIYENQ